MSQTIHMGGISGLTVTRDQHDLSCRPRFRILMPPCFRHSPGQTSSASFFSIQKETIKEQLREHSAHPDIPICAKNAAMANRSKGTPGARRRPTVHKKHSKVRKSRCLTRACYIGRWRCVSCSRSIARASARVHTVIPLPTTRKNASL